MGGNVHAIKEYWESLSVAIKEIRLEVNADKTKYMVMSGDQNGEWSHSIKSDNSFSERVEEFECLGTTLRSQNSLQEEIESRLNSGNACYRAVQKLLSQFAIQKFKN